MKLKIESSNITLTIINAATEQKITKIFRKEATISDVYTSLYRESFIISPPNHFDWRCYYNDCPLCLSEIIGTKGIKSGDVLLFCCREVAYQEITVRVVKGISGADIVLGVPVDATIGDVICGLIAEGFLDSDTDSTTTVLYNKDADGGISSAVKYDDRSKMVKEYGWQNGYTFIAVSVSVAYGCPTAKELPGLVPECMLARFETFSFDSL